MRDRGLPVPLVLLVLLVLLIGNMAKLGAFF